MAAEIPEKPALPTAGRWRWISALSLIAAVFLAYANAVHAPFLFDDTGAVIENPTIRHLLSTAPLNPPNDGSTTTGRPIVNFSFALNYAVSGEAVWSYHALNIVIHALAALTLLGIVRRTFLSEPLRKRYGTAAASLAFLSAMLWALHPLQTESVVCIAQRTESLCGLFYFLALYGFIRGAEAGSRGWLVLSVVACLLGMGTKEVMVTAPLVILLYDRTFLAGTFSSAWRRHRAYYGALVGTWLLLAWLLWQTGGSRGSSAGFGFGISWWTYLLKQSEALVLYLKLSFWPHPLVLDYGNEVVHSLASIWWEGVIVLSLLAGTVWALVRKPSLGFAGAWFFLILSPSSSVVPLVTQTVAEHRMYLPLASLVVLAVVIAYNRLGSPATWALGAAVIVFGSMTIMRNRDYLDGVTIWADTAAKYPQNARAHNNLGWALQQKGKSDAANAQFARAIELQPNYVTAHYSWGVALLDQGKIPEAIAQFESALQLAPKHVDAYLNLGNALMQAHRADEAVSRYEEALRLKPAADVHYNLGVALTELGRTDEAVAHFQAALQLKADLPEAHYQLARLADRAGQAAAAEAHYKEALRLAPNHAAAQAKLGLLLARAGQLDAAAEHLRAAVRLKADDADARANLGNVLLLQGRPREAMIQYEEAIRLRPDDARLRDGLRAARESLP